MLERLINKYKSELNDLEYDINELKRKRETSPLEIEVFVDNLYYIKEIRDAIEELRRENNEELKALDEKLFNLFEEIEYISTDNARETLKKAFFEILKPYLPAPTTV